MDGRSISSRYDFSESENESIPNGQGQTARTVSLANKCVSTVSLFSMRRKMSLRKRGNGMRSAASELFLKEKSDGAAERRPITSYLFSLGRERDGLAEIIPQTLVGNGGYGFGRDGFIQVHPREPTYPNDGDDTMTARCVSYDQWRYSALLPLPRGKLAERPGTCGSSVYSQDFRGLGTVDESPTSMHSQESQRTGGSETVLPGQRLLRTRSLLSLAKRYSSHDDESLIYDHNSPEASGSLSPKQDASSQDDDWRNCSRGERLDTRAGTVFSAVSPLTPTRDSCDLTSLPPLPPGRGHQVFSPNHVQPREGTFDIWWKRSSIVSQNSVGKLPSFNSEVPPHSFSQEARMRRRPSSLSWLTINTIRSDETSSNGDRKSSEASILGGQQYIRASVRTSTESDSSSAARLSGNLMYSPSEERGFSKGQHRMTAENRSAMKFCSEMPEFFHIDGWRIPKQDLFRLPPLKLPELPDEQRVSFYTCCGHFETDPEMVIKGRELQGWCPLCYKGRRSKRKVVKTELKSILRSIAE